LLGSRCGLVGMEHTIVGTVLVVRLLPPEGRRGVSARPCRMAATPRGGRGQRRRRARNAPRLRRKIGIGSSHNRGRCRAGGSPATYTRAGSTAWSRMTWRVMPAISAGSPRSRSWSPRLNQFQHFWALAEAGWAGWPRGRPASRPTCSSGCKPHNRRATGAAVKHDHKRDGLIGLTLTIRSTAARVLQLPVRGRPAQHDGALAPPALGGRFNESSFGIQMTQCLPRVSSLWIFST
jgi:hypothetical protein